MPDIFHLKIITVYTDYEGERTIELLNNAGEVVNELVVNIPEVGDNGYVVNLNWEIPVGNNYILTTDTDMNNQNFGDNNPLLKRTTDGLPNFPYNLDGIVEINEGYYDSGDNPGFSTDYYYYFYNWEINNDWNIGGTSCYSEPTEVNVIIEDNTEIKENFISENILNTFPNPTENNLNIIVDVDMKNVKLSLFDHVGKLIKELSWLSIQKGEQKTINVSDLSPGMYLINFKNTEHNLNTSFTISK